MVNFAGDFQKEKIDDGYYIHRLFENQTKITPEAIAVIFQNKRLTYSQLNQRANNLAAAIVVASPKSLIVGVSALRCIDTIISVLAILKAGKAYLPLDPDYPADRLQQIVSDSGVDLCLSIAAQRHLFEPFGVIVLASDGIYEDVLGSPSFVTKSAAYILYTSGSTGIPKGVSMGHKALSNLLSWQKDHSASQVGFNTLQFSPLIFDVSFQEIFATLTTGGTLILIDNALRVNPYSLLSYIEEYSINRIFFPFVVLQYLTEAAEGSSHFPACLKEVITAGEQLKITPKIIHFFSNLPECVLYNQYGPTETHVVTQLKLAGDPCEWAFLPAIGSPISGVEIFILNESLVSLPAGATGELCVSGVCLADGYLNRPELTAEKFVEWKKTDKEKIRIYRTGDLARYLPDGNIEYLGRMDTQVKIRGNRVELGEIEVLLNQCSDIQQAIVVAREDDNQASKILVAYIVPRKQVQDEQDCINKWRSFLQNKLPDFMIPTEFVILYELPLTSSGKVDRQALPKPQLLNKGRSELVEATTDLEKMVLEIWKKYFGYDKISIRDSFFDLGGHSLMAIMIMTGVERSTGKHLPISSLFTHPTIESIASLLATDKDEIIWDSLVPIKPPGSKKPIYLVHGDGLNVLAFSSLASYMDVNQPVFGLQAKGLNGTDDAPDYLPEIARQYVEEIIRYDPSGSYIIGGYSFGGYIAVEMQRQIIEMGKEVKMLFMLDTEVEKTAYKPWYEVFPKKVRRHIPMLMRDIASFFSNPVDTIKNKWNLLQRLKSDPQTDSNQFYELIEKISAKHWIALKNYEVEPFDGKVYLFKAIVNVHNVSDREFLGWKKYAKKGIEKHMVPGDHLSMLLNPNVEELALILQRTLDQHQ